MKSLLTVVIVTCLATGCNSEQSEHAPNLLKEWGVPPILLKPTMFANLMSMI